MDVPICIRRSFESLPVSFSRPAGGLSPCLPRPHATRICIPKVCFVSSRPLNYSKLKIKREDGGEQWVNIVNNCV